MAAVVDAVNLEIAGGVSGFIVTGTLKGAALGALQAGLFNEAGDALQAAGPAGFAGIGHVASAFIAHGLVGGLVSEIGGGRFSSGFLAGGVSSFAPVPTGGQTWEETIEGAVESAALGGVGSVLGGGKFQDGAITGAFGYLFNGWAHSGRGPNDQHSAGVAQEVEELQRQGLDVLGTEIPAKLPGYPTRIYDIVAQTPDGLLIGIEVKTSIINSFTINQNQANFDISAVASGDAITRFGTIQAVGYTGVCFSCDLGADWQTLRLMIEMQILGINFRTIYSKNNSKNRLGSR